MSVRILALHGFLGRGSDWDRVRAELPQDWTWDCPDMFGPSGWCAGDAGEGAWLAGYSFGARLALRLLAEEPGRWRGALLLSCNPGNFQTDAERAARRASDAAWAAAFLHDEWAELLRRWDAQPVLAGGGAPPRAERDFDRAKLADALISMSVADAFTDPVRLPERLAWLAGERDAKFSGMLGRLRASGFPGVFYAVSGAGHRLLPEAPVDVAQALRALVGDGA